MQELLQRNLYGEVLALKIEIQGARGTAIANRWMLGWPEQTKALIESGAFLQRLMEQKERESLVLAEATEHSHLAEHEILQMYEVPMAPPAPPTKG